MIKVLQPVSDCLISFSISLYTCPTSSVYLVLLLSLYVSRFAFKNYANPIYISLAISSILIAGLKLFIYYTEIFGVGYFILSERDRLLSVIPDVSVLLASIFSLLVNDTDHPAPKDYKVFLISILMVHSGLSMSIFGFLYLLSLLCIILTVQVFKVSPYLVYNFIFILSSIEILFPYFSYLFLSEYSFNIFTQLNLDLLKSTLLLLINPLSALLIFSSPRHDSSLQVPLIEGVSTIRKLKLAFLYVSTVAFLWTWTMMFPGPERLVFMIWMFYSVIQVSPKNMQKLSRFVLMPTLSVAQLCYYGFNLAWIYPDFFSSYCAMSLAQISASLWLSDYDKMSEESSIWSSMNGPVFTWVLNQVYIFSLIVLFFVGLSDINILYTGLMAFCIYFMIDPSALKKYWSYLLLYNMFILLIRCLWVLIEPIIPYNQGLLIIIGLPPAQDNTISDYLLWLLFFSVSLQYIASSIKPNDQESKLIKVLLFIYQFISYFEIWVLYSIILIIQNLSVVNYLNSIRLIIILIIIYKHIADTTEKVIKNYTKVYNLLVLLEVYSGVLLASRYVYQFLKFTSFKDLDFTNFGFEIYEVKQLYASTAADCILLIASVFASRNCKRLMMSCELKVTKKFYKIFKKHFSRVFVYAVLVVSFWAASYGNICVLMLLNIMSISVYQIRSSVYFTEISAGKRCRDKLEELQRRASLWKFLFCTTLVSIFCSYFVYVLNESNVNNEILKILLEVWFMMFGFVKEGKNVLDSSMISLIMLLSLVIERHCLQYNLPSNENEEHITKETLKTKMRFIRVLNFLKSITEALIPMFLLLLAFFQLNFVAILYVSFIFMSFCTADLIHTKFLFVSVNIFGVLEYILLCLRVFFTYFNYPEIAFIGLFSEYPGLLKITKVEKLGVFCEFLAEVFILLYFNYLSFREKELMETEEAYNKIKELQDYQEEEKTKDFIETLKEILINIKKGFYLVSRNLLIGIALLFISQSVGLLSIFYYLFLLVFIAKEIRIYLNKNISSYISLVSLFLRFLVLDLTLQIFIQIPFSLGSSPTLEIWCKCIGLLNLIGDDQVSSSNFTTILFKIYTFLIVLMLHRMMKSKDYEEYLSKFFLELEEKSRLMSEEITEHFNKERIIMNKFYAESNTRFEGELKKIKDNIQIWKKLFQVQLKKSNASNKTLNISLRDPQRSENIEESKELGFGSRVNSFIVSFIDPILFKNFIRKITVFNKDIDSAMNRKSIRPPSQDNYSRRNTDKFLGSKIVNFSKFYNMSSLKEAKESSEDSDSNSSDSSSSSNMSVHSFQEIKFQDSIEKEQATFNLKFKDYILAFLYALASNTESLVYLSFFINNWKYSSLESLIFPISALGYGMLLYPRPPSKYFKIMLYYTEFVFFCKLLFQLEIWSMLIGTEFLSNFHDPLKIGFNLASNTSSKTLFNYILWDVIVLIVLLLHNFYLIKVGFWAKTETEIESLDEAKERLGLKSRETFKAEKKAEKSFIDNILPLNKEEKPGRDYYSLTITIQMFILVYIFCFFTRMDGNSQDISQAIRSNQFQGRMIIVLVIQLSLIIIERYFYVSRTAQALTEAQEAKKVMTRQAPVARFRSSTRYGTDISDDLNKALLSPGLKPADIRPEKKKRSAGVILRIVVFIFLLFAVHFAVFFYLPLNGNISSLGKLFCEKKDEKRCNDFESNYFLQGFYFLYLCYLICTAQQIKYSLPSFSKITFPLMRKIGQLNYYLFLAYRSAPFLFEIRTLMDWTSTNTSLTIFQWFKLEDIYAQLYINECVQVYLRTKEYGEKIPGKTKFFMGFCGLFIILVIIFIPLLVFSTINPIIEVNPVNSASLSINFLYNNRKFNLYSINSAEKIQPVTEEDWESTYQFSKIPQLTSSDKVNMQQVIMPIDSDELWTISPPGKKKLCGLIRESQQNLTEAALIMMRYSFYRNFPLNFNEVSLVVTKNLDNNTLGQLEEVICQEVGVKVVIEKVFDDIVRLPSSGNEIKPLAIQTDRNKSDLLLSLEEEKGQKWWKLSTNEVENGIKFFTISDTYSIITLNFSILTFYISVVYVLGTLLKYATKGGSRNVVMTDMKYTKDLQTLCEGIYISRMISNQKEEEELYYELLDILRSPEITKMITGSSSIKEELEKKKL